MVWWCGRCWCVLSLKSYRMIKLKAILPVRAAQLVEAMECAVMMGMAFEVTLLSDTP